MGIAERQYSVAWPRYRQITGPKPIEKRSTPTPVRRAMAKCPSSCTRIRGPITRMNETLDVNGLSSCPQGTTRRGDATPQRRRDMSASGGVGIEAGVEVVQARRGDAIERLGDQLRNLREPDTALEKRRHCHLV